jgi:hypothetical protein
MVTVASLALFLANQAASAAAPPVLVETTTKAAVQVAGGEPAVGVSPVATRLSTPPPRPWTPLFLPGAALVVAALGFGTAIFWATGPLDPSRGHRVKAVPLTPDRAPIQGFPVRLGEPSQLEFRAFPVEVDGQPDHALILTEGVFTVDAAGHLTARLSGTALPYDRVRMTVSAWVYDATGNVLATAIQRHVIERKSDPLGRVPVTFDFDFGAKPRFRSVVRVTLTAWPA